MSQQHTQTAETPMSRIDARIPLSVRETIDWAAALQGRSRTDFLIAATMEKAEQVIAQHTIIRLSLRDQEMLARALAAEEVEEPTPYVISVLKEYAETVTSR